MKLMELKYVLAVYKAKHYARAAESMNVSQPTLSVAIKKLENELNVVIFERGSGEVTTTPIGQRIVDQAQRVIEATEDIYDTARRGQDPLTGPLRLGIIYTVAPYIIPKLVGNLRTIAPQMPLILHEHFTTDLFDKLKTNEIDCAIMAITQPIEESQFEYLPLYKEDFVLAVNTNHSWASKESISIQDVQRETMLLLGAGHCLRDQIIKSLPEANYSNPKERALRSFEGSSLHTILHMVSAGLGITLIPNSAVQEGRHVVNIKFVKLLETTTNREVGIVFRKTFPRTKSIDAVVEALRTSSIKGIEFIEKSKYER